jgi:hypothetical protein
MVSVSAGIAECRVGFRQISFGLLPPTGRAGATRNALSLIGSPDDLSTPDDPGRSRSCMCQPFNADPFVLGHRSHFECHRNDPRVSIPPLAKVPRSFRISQWQSTREWR